MRPGTVDLRDLYGSLEHAGEPVTIESMNEDIADAAAKASRRPRRA